MGLFDKKTKHEIKASNIKCVHCCNRIINSLKEKNVKTTVDIDTQTISVSFNENKISLEEIKNIINELGFNCQ